MQEELEKWQPLIPIPFNDDHLEETIHEFGNTVDEIEDADLTPPPESVLRSKPIGMKVTFAVQLCRNC